VTIEQNKSSTLAIGKSESATGKSIDELRINIASSTSNLSDKIADMKDRFTSMDSVASQRMAGLEASISQRLSAIEGRARGAGDVWGYIVGGIGVLLAIVSFILSHRGV
jgi:hypothetical protein